MTPAMLSHLAAQGRRAFGLLFDLDDTLVDTSETFDACVLRLSGASLSQLLKLRSEGGFNDDWRATQELLSRSGVQRALAEIEREGLQLYLGLAPGLERLWVDLERLVELGRSHPLLIFTGRVREEYQPVWGSRLDPVFDEVLCKGDPGVLHTKPHPQGLQLLLERHRLEGGVYVGNSVDDMAAARAAGLIGIGVTTNQSAETLLGAGAQLVARSVDQVLDWLEGSAQSDSAGT